MRSCVKCQKSKVEKMLTFFSFPPATEMFHFAGCPHHRTRRRCDPATRDRVTPFGNPRINARLAAPRGISSPATSFIGIWCLGIHPTPLVSRRSAQRTRVIRSNHCASLPLGVADSRKPIAGSTTESPSCYRLWAMGYRLTRSDSEACFENLPPISRVRI